jgi:hypothetical protein
MLSVFTSALEQVKKVLDTTRTPLCFGDVHHTYADKYSLTEFLARVALSAESTCLQVVFKGFIFHYCSACIGVGTHRRTFER